MKINKQDNGIVLISNDSEFTIIDSNGQIQLKELHKFMMFSKEHPNISNGEILFDSNIEEDLQNGLKIFIKDILAKSNLTDFKDE